MSFDGELEVKATIAKLKAALVGGRVYDGLPDEAVLGRDANGPLPYIVVVATTPIPLQTERRLAVGEQDQPYILPITVTAYAQTQPIARATNAGVIRLLVGWQPGGDNSTLFEISGGYSRTATDAQNKPTRFEQGSNLLTTINQSTAN